MGELIDNVKINPFLAQAERYQPTARVFVFRVPTSAPYIVQLPYLPEYYGPADPNKIQILNFADMSQVFQEVYTSNYSVGNPSAGKYIVDYRPNTSVPDRAGTGKVLFSSSDAGKWLICYLKFIGSMNLYSYSRENTPILDYRGFSSLTSFACLHSVYVHGGYGYVLYSYSLGNNNVVLGRFPINSLNAPLQTITNGTLSTSGVRKNARIITYLDSSNKIGAFYTSSGNVFEGKKSVNPLGADMGGWSNITLPVNFTQFSCSCQVGNQLYIFGCNSTLNTNSNQVIKYNVDTNTAVVLGNMPNNWVYGAAVFNGYGQIRLFGNRAAGYEGQSLSFSIWSHTFTSAGSIDSSLLLFNGGALLDESGSNYILPFQTNSGDYSYLNQTVYHTAEGKYIAIPTRQSISDYGSYYEKNGVNTQEVVNDMGGTITLSKDAECFSKTGYVASNVERLNQYIYKNFTGYDGRIIAGWRPNANGNGNIYQFRNSIIT